MIVIGFLEYDYVQVFANLMTQPQGGLDLGSFRGVEFLEGVEGSSGRPGTYRPSSGVPLSTPLSIVYGAPDDF